jgi:hypothetical protein
MIQFIQANLAFQALAAIMLIAFAAMEAVSFRRRSALR